MADSPILLRGTHPTKNMKVVSFSIFKGGTGKTTSTVNTAAALVNKGKRVLLVDLDQQASATRYLVLGKSPEIQKADKGGESAASVYSGILKKADELGVRRMSLEDLLKRTGFKNESHVVKFGPGSNVQDFKPRQVEELGSHGIQPDSFLVDAGRDLASLLGRSLRTH